MAKRSSVAKKARRAEVLAKSARNPRKSVRKQVAKTPQRVEAPPKAPPKAPALTVRLFGNLPQAKVESYSTALLRTIRRELGGVTFFTREDLLHVPLLNFVSTMYRYHLVCILVRYLAHKGDLIIKNRTDLILRDHEKAYSETPLREQYYEVISAIVTDMPLQSKTTIMDIVALWTTDAFLTINNKRVAVRGAITGLIKAGLLRRVDAFQFVVRKAS